MFGVGSCGLMDAASLTVIKTYSIFPLIAFIASLPVAKWVQGALERVGLRQRGMERARVAWLSVCLVLSVLFLVGQTYNPFIYFQF